MNNERLNKYCVIFNDVNHKKKKTANKISVKRKNHV